MIWVIEFRSGSYLQQNGMDSGTLTGAKRFDSEREANSHINLHEWLAINGAMAKLMRASRHTDLELVARIVLRTLPPGSLSAPPSAVALLEKKLSDIAQAIWTQGWDCREEQGPLAGAFGHANRYNPYRRTPEPTKCRGCGDSPLRTERGRCEDCGDCQGCGDEDCPHCQVFPKKGIPEEDVALAIHKLRDDPVPTMAYLTGPLCHQEGGVIDHLGHRLGRCTFAPGHDGRHSWEPTDT